MAKRALKVAEPQPVEDEVTTTHPDPEPELPVAVAPKEVKKMSFKIARSIPLPAPMRVSAPARRKYPFEEMEVGDMFFVPGKEKNTLSTHTSTVSKQMGRKFTTRMIYMAPVGEGDEIEWVPAEKGDASATLGIGVWRVE